MYIMICRIISRSGELYLRNCIAEIQDMAKNRCDICCHRQNYTFCRFRCRQIHIANRYILRSLKLCRDWQIHIMKLYCWPRINIKIEKPCTVNLSHDKKSRANCPMTDCPTIEKVPRQNVPWTKMSHEPDCPANQNTLERDFLCRMKRVLAVLCFSFGFYV